MKGRARLKNKNMVKVGTCANIEPEMIPAAVGREIARALLPAILRDYDDPEIKADFQRWKAERLTKSKQ